MKVRELQGFFGHGFDRILKPIHSASIFGWRLDAGAGPRGRAVRHPHDLRDPGYFRTELPTKESRAGRRRSIENAERNAAQRAFWEGQNGPQGDDAAKLARSLVTLASEAQPPLRFLAGADAVATAERKVADLRAQLDAYRDLSWSVRFDDPDQEKEAMRIGILGARG